MTWCHAKIKEQAQMKHTVIMKIWKSSEASVLGRHNTPPLQEDLVPRSRMAPERNGRERGKTKLLLQQKSETKEPWEVEKLKERTQRSWIQLRALRLKIETRNTMWTLEVAKLWMTNTMDKKELEPLWLKWDARLDKMKKNLKRGYDTPVKWTIMKRTWPYERDDGLRRATSQSFRNERNRR